MLRERERGTETDSRVERTGCENMQAVLSAILIFSEPVNKSLQGCNRKTDHWRKLLFMNLQHLYTLDLIFSRFSAIQRTNAHTKTFTGKDIHTNAAHA